MKIKFEIKLTASKALLAIVAALIGTQQSIASEDNTEKPVFVPDPRAGKLLEPAGECPPPAEAPIPAAPEVTKKKRNTGKTVEQLVPEKIVPPVPTPEAEVTETETTTEDAATEQALTIDDIRNFAGKLLQEKPALREKVMDVLSKHGASKFSEAAPKDYASILADFKTLA